MHTHNHTYIHSYQLEYAKHCVYSFERKTDPTELLTRESRVKVLKQGHDMTNKINNGQNQIQQVTFFEKPDNLKE